MPNRVRGFFPYWNMLSPLFYAHEAQKYFLYRWRFNLGGRKEGGKIDSSNHPKFEIRCGGELRVSIAI